MTSQNELLWEQAVGDEDFGLATEIASKAELATKQETTSPLESSGSKTQKAILNSALYWSIDYGSLHNREP